MADTTKSTPRQLHELSRSHADELFRRHHDQLVRLLQGRLGISREVAEDACSLAWVQLLRVQPSGDRIVGWLYTVVIRAFVHNGLGRLRGDASRAGRCS